MTPKQYRAAIAQLELSQVRAAKFLGVSGRTSQNWALGTRPIPVATAKLLRLMLKLNLSPQAVDGA